MYKKCINCEESKLKTLFGKCKKNYDGLQGKCKECKRLYDNNFYKDKGNDYKLNKRLVSKDRVNKVKLFVYNHFKENPCDNCGEIRIPALDFHHLKDKSFNISDGVSKGYSLSKIKTEIAKCRVLCSNCHRVETAKELGWYSFLKE